MWEFQPKKLICLVVMISAQAKQGSILAHIFAVVGVVCGADTNSQDTKDEDSAKYGISQFSHETSSWSMN